MPETNEKTFRPDMTVAEALNLHPDAPKVFAAFSLTGCALCHLSQVETIQQVCEGYGLDMPALLDMLEKLLQE